VTDITERKRAEQELHQNEDSFRETQAELAHVSRVTTMGELAASIAHELNQPLTGVVSNANASLRWLAADSPNIADASEAIRAIIRDGNRAAEVVSRMRALFKKARPVKEQLNINETNEEVVILTRGEVRRNKVILRTELAVNLPLLMGDRVQLQQVVVNLILNAIEARAQWKIVSEIYSSGPIAATGMRFRLPCRTLESALIHRAWNESLMLSTLPNPAA
jgi:C4-dicarboxylate-specific signal transduction histidine kinase